MSANQILPMIGGLAGKYVAGMYAPKSELLGSLGWFLGSMLLSQIGPTNKVQTQGNRLSDLSVQSSAYGSTIPLVFGTVKLSGNIIWGKPLHEVKSTRVTQQGKGVSGVRTTETIYDYYGRFAVALCEGPIEGVKRIWANGDMLFDQGKHIPSGKTYPMDLNGAMPDEGVELWPGVRLFFGTETQLPSAYIESFEGVGEYPAHRGLAYVVFEEFFLEKYGNSLPALEFEISNYVAYEEPVSYTVDFPVDDVPDDARWISDYDQTTGLLAMYVIGAEAQPLYIQRQLYTGELVIDVVPLPDMLQVPINAVFTTIATVGGYAYLAFFTWSGVYYAKVALSATGDHKLVAYNAPSAPMVGPFLSVENGGLPYCMSVTQDPLLGMARLGGEVQHADAMGYSAFARVRAAGPGAVTGSEGKIYAAKEVSGEPSTFTDYFIPLRQGEVAPSTDAVIGQDGQVIAVTPLDQPLRVLPLGWSAEGNPTGGWVALWLGHTCDIATFDNSGALLSQQSFDNPASVIYWSVPYIDVARQQVVYPGAIVQLWEL